MNYLTLILGVLALAYGVFTIIQRKRKPESFSKFEAMKGKWGDKAGTIMHFISYSLVPILLGLTVIVLELLKLCYTIEQ